MLQVYVCDISDLQVNESAAPLSSYRLEKLQKQKSETARRQGIGAELLLIRALRERLGEITLPLEIGTDPGGKPFLKGMDLFFSLSHSGDLAACALSDEPIGLDIQKQSRFREDFIQRFYSPDERQAVLESDDRDGAFTEIWAKKESYLKAIGSGVSVPLASFSSLRPPAPAEIWCAPMGAYRLAVCSLGSGAAPDRIRQIRLP